MNQAWICFSTAAAYFGSPVSSQADVREPTARLKSTIAFRCSEKLSGLLSPSRRMYGPSGFSGSGHQ